MLVVVNEKNLINFDNVTHALVSGATISFYFASGESRHFPCTDEELAQVLFENIKESARKGKTICEVGA